MPVGLLVLLSVPARRFRRRQGPDLDDHEHDGGDHQERADRQQKRVHARGVVPRLPDRQCHTARLWQFTALFGPIRRRHCRDTNRGGPTRVKAGSDPCGRRESAPPTAWIGTSASFSGTADVRPHGLVIGCMQFGSTSETQLALLALRLRCWRSLALLALRWRCWRCWRCAGAAARANRTLPALPLGSVRRLRVFLRSAGASLALLRGLSIGPR